MSSFHKNFVIGRFETESDRSTCIKFLRDSLITYENLINKYTGQGYTTETSGALREAIEMHIAFRKALSTVFYRTAVKN